MINKEHAPEAHTNHNHHAESPAEQQHAAREAIERGKNAEHKARESIDTIRESIEKQARTTEQMDDRVDPKESHKFEKQAAPHAITRSVKKTALQKQLKHTRRKLSTPERTFSRVIHQPVVDKVSTVAGNTIARPSGILIGGIGALIGSIALYYMSKHYGFTYNFLAYAFLFTACYVAGVVGEYMLRSLRKLGRKH